MELISLSSGSKGNCYLIQNNNTRILLDAGLSCSKIVNLLYDVGLTLSDMSGVVITHEHTDHICGLKKISDYVPVYAHQTTMNAIEKKVGYINNKVETKNYEMGFEIGDIEVLPFRIPHDAAYPLGYSFFGGDKKFSISTDTGCVTHGIVKNMQDADLVVIEANHDIEMLKKGNYTECLKRRILSQNGHLSNNAAALLIEKIINDKLKHIILGHLSEANNRDELALEAAHGAILKCGAKSGALSLTVAHQSQVSNIFEVK